MDPDSLDSVEVLPHQSQRKLIGKPFYTHVFLNNVPVVALIDPGSAVNIISNSLFAANPHWHSTPVDIALSFANGELGHVKFASFNNVVSACGYVAPKTDFVIAPFDTPLVDIELNLLEMI